MDKKSNQIGVRLDDALFSRLKALEKHTGMPSSTLVRMLIEAALDYYDTEKQMVFPIACVPKKDLGKIYGKTKN